MASRSPRFHGRVEGAADHCAVPGCAEPGEFRAPLTAPTFDGPGAWQWLCLDHVRAHNARYNYFAGMSTEEIERAQSPVAGWDRATRAFAHNGADPAPPWADFADPLEAIRGRFTRPSPAAPSRFSPAEKSALAVLGLGDDVDLAGVRKAYSVLVRRYHPDRNGGDRTHEAKLRNVIDAWQTLKVASAFG